MRKPGGYAFLTDRLTGDIIKERDSFTCPHCSQIVHVQPKADPNEIGYCHKCNKPICKWCQWKLARGAPCKTWEAKVAELDRAIERSMGRVSTDELNKILGRTR